MNKQKFYLGRNVQSFEKNDSVKPVSQVIINYGTSDSGATLTKVYPASPSGNGRTVELTLNTLPDGDTAQTIAQNIYQSYQANTIHTGCTVMSSELDALAELGDAMTVDGVYTSMGDISTEFSKAMYADIKSQGITEKDDFPYLGSVGTKTERDLATMKASITVNANNITAEVTNRTNADNALGTRIDQRLNSISLTVSGTTGTTSFVLKDGSTTLDTETFDLHVKSVNVEGTITADTVKSDWVYAGEINGTQITADTLALSHLKCRGDSVTIKDSNGNTYGYLGYGTGSTGTSTTSGVMLKANSSYYVIATTAGVRLQSSNSSMALTDSKLILSSTLYGSTLPSNPSVGQIFFYTGS